MQRHSILPSSLTTTSILKLAASHKRYLDLLSDDTLSICIKIINSLRRHLDLLPYAQQDHRQPLGALGFLEVEMLMIRIIAWGATNHNDLRLNLSLRVAPELSFKEIIMNGVNLFTRSATCSGTKGSTTCTTTSSRYASSTWTSRRGD